MKISTALRAFPLSAFLFFAVSTVAAAEVPVVAPAKAPAAQKYDPTKAVPTAPASPAPATAPAAVGKAFLWEVKSKTNVVYLFGTIHVGKRAFYPLPSQVEEAFGKSQRLVVEADISNNEGMADVESVINYKAPDSLDKHIPAALFGRLKTQLERLQIPVDAVAPMKPFLIGGFLSIAEFSKLGFDMNMGVDSYLVAKAHDDKKQILELESQMGQLKMLNGMSPALQEAFLDNAVSMLETGKVADQVSGMVNAWQSGDVKLMQDVTSAANKGSRMRDQLDDVLLHSRHEAMLKKIGVYLGGNVPHFIAVGSLHLVGPRGLVEILKARGFEVKQL
jgi:uncharacterized protein